MDARNFCRATLLSMALLLAQASLHKPARGAQSELNVHIHLAKRADIILISFNDKWKEAHASFSRMLNQTRTAWHIRNGGLRKYVFKNTLKNTETVLVEANHDIDLRTVPRILHELLLMGHCMRWLFLRVHIDMKPGYVLSPVDLPPCHHVELVGVSDNLTASVALSETRAKVTSSELTETPMRFVQENSGSTRLSSHRLTIGCVGIDDERTRTTCRHRFYRQMVHLLSKTNLSIVVRSFPTYRDVFKEIYRHRVDIALVLGGLKAPLLAYVDFHYLVNLYEAFYARESSTRFISLVEIAGHSWSLVFALTLALISVSLALEATRDHLKLLSCNLRDKVMLLMAALLSTSAEEPPELRNRTVTLRILYAAWFMAILPLSVYIRSEVTAMLTIKRPTDRMDTLQELEYALDKHEVAPCVINNSLMHHLLRVESDQDNEGSLMQKLRAAYRRQNSKKLVKKDIAECLVCGVKNDQVCYYFQKDPCYIRGLGSGATEFKESFKMQLVGFPARKVVRKVLTRLFRAAEESQLIRFNRGNCTNEIEKSKVEYEFWGFFFQYLLLLALSVAVLVSEILVCWCSAKHTNILAFLKAVTQSSQHYVTNALNGPQILQSH